MNITHYKWLIVVEGSSDVNTFTKLLKQFGVQEEYSVKYVGGKENVFRFNNWKEKPIGNNRVVSQFTLQSDQGRPGFSGVILVVDSDEKENLMQNYAGYSQECRSSFVDYADWHQPREIEPSIIQLDTIKGIGRELPI